MKKYDLETVEGKESILKDFLALEKINNELKKQLQWFMGKNGGGDGGDGGLTITHYGGGDGGS